MEPFIDLETTTVDLEEPSIDPVTTTVTLVEDDIELEYEGLTYEEAEDNFRSIKKQNSTFVINNLKMQPSIKFRLHIPLCRLVSMPLVRPTMRSDVKRLEADFVHGYRDGDRVFYVSLTSDTGEEKLVTTADEEGWGLHWQEENEEFEAKVKADPVLSLLSGHMFFVWDGNHRLLAWRQFIDRAHLEDRDWHLSVECIVLAVGDSSPVLLNAMHDINMSTENSHVKTNLVHNLYRVKKYGQMKLEDFKPLISPEDFKKCKHRKKQAWYPLITEVFVSFLNQQELSKVADNAARKYNEVTTIEERTPHGIAQAMQAACRKQVKQLLSQFVKQVSVADPALGDDFLLQVKLHWESKERPEMTLEKLQMVATALVAPEFKIRWLRWWNARPVVRAGVCFPKAPVSDNRLLEWLNKAAFFAGLEEAATTKFDSLLKNSELVLSNIDTELLMLKDYLEKWRIQIWEHGFFNFFKGKSPFMKFSVFGEHPGTQQAVQRLLYRYITREMVGAKAIENRGVPIFLSSWIDKSSENCMFDEFILKTWKLSHLKIGAWYLECPRTACPADEAALFAQIDALAVNDVLSEELRESEDDLEIMDSIAGGSHVDVAAASTPHISRSTSKGSRRGLKRSQQIAVEKRAELEVLPVHGSAQGKGVNQSSPLPRIQVSPSTASNSSTQFGAFQPPHLRAFFALAGVKPSIDVSVLIVNDSLSAMLQVQESSGMFPTSFEDITSFLTKSSLGRAIKFDGVPSTKPFIDLFILDLPEGLPVPEVSDPPSLVPDWNAIPPTFLEDAFEYASNHLHDDAAMLIFLPDDIKVKREILGYLAGYSFMEYREWLGVNCLQLVSTRDPTRRTLRFRILLLVRIGKTWSSGFQFQECKALSDSAVDLLSDDVVHNFTTRDTTLMNGGVPWRGAREKDPSLLRLLIEATTKPGDVVFDYNASTGASVKACKASGRHVVALESDKAIFDALLKPLMSVGSPTTAGPSVVTIDDDEEGLQPAVTRIKRMKFSK